MAEAKTMAVRVPPQLHARATVLAKLSKRSLADVLTEAIETYVDGKWSDPAIRRGAQEVLDQLAADAATQRQALESLLSGSEKTESQPRKRGSRQ